MNCSKPGMERSTWAYNFTRWWFCTFFESHWKITLSWTSAYFFENTPFFDGNYFKIICMLISNQAFSFNETSHLAKKSWNICTIGFAFQMLNRQSNLSWIWIWHFTYELNLKWENMLWFWFFLAGVKCDLFTLQTVYKNMLATFLCRSWVVIFWFLVLTTTTFITLLVSQVSIHTRPISIYNFQ